MSKSHEAKPVPVIPIALAIIILAAIIGGLAMLGGGATPEPPTGPGGEPAGPGPDAGVLRVDREVTPERFRKEGQSYAVKLLSTLNGRATHEDWGVSSALTVNYVVTLRYNETVLESTADKLLVERHILELRHRLFTSVEDIDLSQDMDRLWGMLDYVAVVEPRVGQAKAAVGKAAETLRDKLLAESQRLDLNWAPLLERIGKDPASAVKTLASQLEGRKVKLLWTREAGVTILEGAEDLPAQERRLLQRASLLADGALFPNVNKRRGERWDVDARHFSDFLDVGLDGALRGKVSLRRDADGEVEGQPCAHLSLVGGTIQVIRDDDSREARGALSPGGDLFYDLEDDLIREATLEGQAKASFASKDHLLFKARFKGTPRFTVRYEAHIRR